jgi:hypothetical protein
MGTTIPEAVVKTTAQLIRTNKTNVGLIIWKMAKANCDHPTTSAYFEEYMHQLAIAVGMRGGNRRAKNIRKTNEKQMSFKI